MNVIVYVRTVHMQLHMYMYMCLKYGGINYVQVGIVTTFIGNTST